MKDRSVIFSRGNHRFSEGPLWRRLKWQYVVGAAIAVVAIFASTMVAASAGLEDGSSIGSGSGGLGDGSGGGGTGQNCAGVSTVLFIGVRGSGEPISQGNGYGTEIDKVRAAFVANLRRGASVQLIALDYSADAVTDLATPSGTTKYFASISDGEIKLLNILYAARAKCAAQKVVLAGYSQGALVINQAVRDFDYPDQVKGIALVADPARVANQVGSSLGSAKPGYGIYRTVYPVSPLPADLGPATNSLCNAGDLVCDWSHVSIPAGIGTGIATHMTYWIFATSQLSELGRRAAARI